MWGEVLEAAVGEKLYLGACENVQQVKKSAEGYLGKYMTKSGEEVKEVIDAGQEWMLPRQWWFSTAALKRLLKARSVRGVNTGRLLDEVVGYLLGKTAPGEGVWLREIVVDLEGFKYHAGWVGKLPVSWCDDLVSMLDSVRYPQNG